MSDFEIIFGKPASEMDEGEFKMAVQSSFHALFERLDNINGKTACIPRHDKLIWVGTGITPFLLAWLIYLTKKLFGVS